MPAQQRSLPINERITLEAQPLPSGPEAPTEVRLLPAGKFRTTKGTFTFDAESAKALMAAATEYGNLYCFDYGHSMIQPEPGTHPADAIDAAGHYELDLRGDGELWTKNLQWTERARQMLTQKRVRYISPTFLVRNGKPIEWVNAALTNLPATKGMKPLVNSRNEDTNQEYPMESVLAALGLSKSAAESDAVAQATALRDLRKEVIALTGKQDISEALEEVSGWKERAAETAALAAKLDKFKAKKAEKKVKNLVREAIAEKRLPPSLEERAMELGRKDVKFLKGYLKELGELAALSKKAKEKSPDSEGSDTAMLSKDEIEITKALGIDPKKFAASKAKGVVQSEMLPKDADGDAGKGDATTSAASATA